MINLLNIFLLFIIIGLGFLVWYLAKKNKENENEILALEKEKKELDNFGSGLEEYNKKMQEKKEQAKEKIMELFGIKDKISHSEVVKELGVSKNTVIRYLDELETENKVKQVGKTGQSVFYTKI